MARLKVLDKTVRSAGAETKDRIISTAIDLFSGQGYAGVSIRDITKTVGIKESSLYHHFVNKQELIETIYLYFKKELKSSLPGATPISPGIKPNEVYIKLQAYLISLKKALDRPLMRKIFRIISMERFRDRQAFEIMHYDIYDSIRLIHEELFSSMLSSGLIKPLLEPRLLAQEYTYSLLGMFEDYNILKHYDKPTGEIEGLMFDYLKFFWERAKFI